MFLYFPAEEACANIRPNCVRSIPKPTTIAMNRKYCVIQKTMPKPSAGSNPDSRRIRDISIRIFSVYVGDLGMKKRQPARNRGIQILSSLTAVDVGAIL